MKKIISLLVLVPMLNTAVFAEDVKTNPPAKPWGNQAELSFNNTTGNSRTQTTSAKDSFKYDWTHYGLQLDGGAFGASNREGVTAENYFASEKVTRKLNENNYLFENFKWDKDRFAGIRDRYNFTGGFGRKLLNLPADTLSFEGGVGYLNTDFYSAPRQDAPSGRLYAKYVHHFNEHTSFSQDAEYVPELTTIHNYLVNTETALTAALNSYLSVKTAYDWKRNNNPPAGAVKDDTLTSIALVVNY